MFLLDEKNFPLMVCCPTCQSAEGVKCTEHDKVSWRGMAFVDTFHFSRIDFANAVKDKVNAPPEKS